MPWWAWLVIWASLALGLLGMLAVSGWLLFRKLLGLVDGLGELVVKAELLGRAEEALDDQTQLAILLGRTETRRRRALLRTTSVLRRDARRQLRLDRARRLVTVDATGREWFPSN